MVILRLHTAAVSHVGCGILKVELVVASFSCQWRMTGRMEVQIEMVFRIYKHSKSWRETCFSHVQQCLTDNTFTMFHSDIVLPGIMKTSCLSSIACCCYVKVFLFLTPSTKLRHRKNALTFCDPVCWPVKAPGAANLNGPFDQAQKHLALRWYFLSG